MRKTIPTCVLVAAVLMVGFNVIAGAKIINGAGASFPNPLYMRWAYEYEKLTKIRLDYQSIGSGGGIKQIKAKTVDFGASDAPMKADELDSLGLIQFPAIMGGVVPIINIEGIESGGLVLSGEVLGDIYLGKITKWNDPAISALNEGVNLPDMDITVVHRADGSGTTWIFANYLDRINETWHEKVGVGKALDWPTGVGGKGNEGVAVNVQRVTGSIGYVEFAYALNNKIPYAKLINKSGKIVEPTIESFSAACSNADWASSESFYVILVDQPGDDTWPICGASFILIYKQRDGYCESIKLILDYFQWAFENGDEAAVELHYVPIPDDIVELVKEKWSTDITHNNETCYPMAE